MLYKPCSLTSNLSFVLTDVLYAQHHFVHWLAENVAPKDLF